MPKGIPNQKYTGEIKQQVVETMHREQLGFSEAAKQFGIGNRSQVSYWERIYI